MTDQQKGRLSALIKDAESIKKVPRSPLLHTFTVTWLIFPSEEIHRSSLNSQLQEADRFWPLQYRTKNTGNEGTWSFFINSESGLPSCHTGTYAFTFLVRWKKEAAVVSYKTKSATARIWLKDWGKRVFKGKKDEFKWMEGTDRLHQPFADALSGVVFPCRSMEEQGAPGAKQIVFSTLIICK